MHKTKKRKHTRFSSELAPLPDIPRGNLNTGNSQVAGLLAVIRQERPKPPDPQGCDNLPIP